MSTHGGYRPGSGRKPKADEEKIRGLAVSAIEKKHGDLETGFMRLLESNEPSLIKFVWEHAVGKPREKIDLDNNMTGGPAVILQMPAGTNISLPDNTEEPDNLEDEGSSTIQE